MMLHVLLSAALCAGPEPEPAADFIDDVRLVFQVVTCQGGEWPPPLDAKVVDAYCARMRPKFERFRRHWGVKARDFLATQRPADVPGELVYPFGGGDLMMALTAFPDAAVITTLSLELAGDPRRLSKASDASALEQSLRVLEEAATTTLLSNDSKSVNLSKAQRGLLPGQLSMHLMGLALHDLEPVSVRFFRVEPDGGLHYFTRAEVDAEEARSARKLKPSWKDPDFSAAFANVEVQFVPRGAPEGPRRVHRHLAVNLSNEELAKTGVLAHLSAKGQVAAMTKAASYLLWRDAFSTLRDWLVTHAAFMVSDSTGVPPRFWAGRGCRVRTFGSFQKSFLGTWEGFQQELREAFAEARPLPMRFGYPDGSPEKRNHLMVVSCPAPR